MGVRAGSLQHLDRPRGPRPVGAVCLVHERGGIQANHSVQYPPEKNRTDTPVTDIDSEGDIHVWTIRYQDGSATLTQNEGIFLGPYPAIRSQETEGLAVPGNCRNKGVFLRVFNADVTFSNISIEQFTD